MIIIDKILEWARERGYTAVYGSHEQVNEMLTDVQFSDSKDGTAVVMHLITDSATVDGRDRAVVAVYFASLCPFDFDGEALLPEQERLKGIGKELLNDIRTGHEMTYADPRWQYGYDDYAENVCWVCLRVTLTASAADCVPLSPEPPTPQYHYDLFCPQIVRGFNNAAGLQNPVFKSSGNQSIYINFAAPAAYSFVYNYAIFANDKKITSTGAYGRVEITDAEIENMKNWMQQRGAQMTEETETWLRARIGYYLCTLQLNLSGLVPPVNMLIGYSATNYECKEAHNL